MKLLHLNTALPTASICISDGTACIDESFNERIQDHASWLQPAIKTLLERNGVAFSDLSAVSVAGGPGSYTGLRVGLSAAKGLCYALNLPLILINTLEMMNTASPLSSDALNCPMIDARRQEVFTAIFNHTGKMELAPTNLILEPDSLSSFLDSNHIYFFGDGCEKFSKLTTHPNANFISVDASSKHLIPLALKRISAKEFSDLAYSEPFYGKEFFTPAPKPHH